MFQVMSRDDMRRVRDGRQSYQATVAACPRGGRYKVGERRAGSYKTLEGVMLERVGFVGLGLMGMPMARNLAAAGYELVLYNRTSEKAAELARERGATVASSPREVAEESDVTITMLPGPPEVEEIVAGEEGLLEGAREGSLLVDMSTSSPVLARRLAATARDRGVGMLDARSAGPMWAPRRGYSRSWSGGKRRTSSVPGPSSVSWGRKSSTSDLRGPARW